MASIAGMKHLGKVVRQIRLSKGLTLEAVANQVPDYDSGNLSRFERGKQDIALPKLEAIAAVLQTPSHEMMRRAGEVDDGVHRVEEVRPSYQWRDSLPVAGLNTAPQNEIIQGVVRMPVLNDAQAASLAVSADALSTAAEHVHTTEDLGPGAFGWRVPDDSMVSDGPLSFSPGVTVLFRPAMAHAAGDCVLVRLGITEVQFCQLTRAAGIWYMTSLNRRYQPRPLPDGATILGVAVAAQFRVPRGGT